VALAPRSCDCGHVTSVWPRHSIRTGQGWRPPQHCVTYVHDMYGVSGDYCIVCVSRGSSLCKLMNGSYIWLILGSYDKRFNFYVVDRFHGFYNEDCQYCCLLM